MASSRLLPRLVAGFFCWGVAGIDDTDALVQVKLHQEPAAKLEKDVPTGIPQLKTNETYFGEVGCTFGRLGIRMKVVDFPGTVRVNMWPLARSDITSGLMCHPITDCHIDMTMGGVSFDYNHFNFSSTIPQSVGNKTLDEDCSWPAFTLTGKSTGYMDLPYLQGVLDPPPTIPASYDNMAKLRDSWECKQEDEQLERHGFRTTCGDFVMNKCPLSGRPREDADKIIFALEAMPSLHPGHNDMGSIDSEKKATAILYSPYFQDAFGPKATRPIKTIYCAPTARAIQTAALAFGQLKGVKIVLDINLIDYPHKLRMEHFLEAVGRATALGWWTAEAANEVVEQYKVISNQVGQFPKDTVEKLMARLYGFKYMLRMSKEKRFIAVVHRAFFFMNQVGLAEPEHVAPFLLNTSMGLEVYEPFCEEEM